MNPCANGIRVFYGGVMFIRINGEDLPLACAMSIAVLIVERKIRPETIVVEYNGVIINRDKWETVILKENDRLEIISFVGGG